MADIRTWSCEIGVIPEQMIPDGGDAPFRNVVAECWDRIFPGVPCSISSGWGRVTAALPEHSVQSEPYLGLATTEELMRELITRFVVHYPHNDVKQMDMTSKALYLAEILGSLSAPEKEYRTVDS
jgi:hypothetical protein